jgi:hypothetical protein
MNYLNSRGLLSVCATVLSLTLVGCGDSDDDAASSDAAVKDAAVKGAAAKDASSSMDHDSVDASHAGDAGATTSDCKDRACWCEQLCNKIATAGCPDDVPLDECVSDCKETAMPECSDQKSDLVACRAQKPQFSFHCDGEYVLDGCDPEQEAYATCRGL